MKISQLAEYSIIVAGVIFGFRFVDNLFFLLYELLLYSGEYGFSMKYHLRSLFFIAVYFTAFVLLIRYSGTIARWLLREEGDRVSGLTISWQHVLWVVMIGMSLSIIVTNLPDTLSYLYKSFQKGSGSSKLDPEKWELQKDELMYATLRTALALIILVFYRQISHWFIRKHEANDLIFESKEEKQ
ncbi:MAG TPA: hypothetical protein PLO99_16045 [Chitinophagaceae bacterium]|nr:hypothetical protein [Chitinophagaceae bacterium]